MSAGPKYKKPQKKAEPVVKREKASTGWNNNNVPESKFFDKSQDKKPKSSGLGGGGGIQLRP
jgi:hypothetical protein